MTNKSNDMDVAALEMDAEELCLESRDFLLSREPIVNLKQELAGYQLLFRDPVSYEPSAEDSRSVTQHVVDFSTELALRNVIGSALAFIDVDAGILMTEAIFLLPRQRVVLTIPGTLELTPDLMVLIAKFVTAGYTFAMADVVGESERNEMLEPLIEIVKIDISQLSSAQLLVLRHGFMKKGKKLLVEKIDTVDQFEMCSKFGFDFYQGYYFAKVDVRNGKKATQLSDHVMRILALILSGGNNFEIVRSIEENAVLKEMLLHLVNTPIFGFRRHIDTLDYVLLVLGHLQLKHWLQVLLYADQGRLRGVPCSPLLIMAATRGKMCELLAQAIEPGNSCNPDVAFTVGVLSLADVLFNRDLTSIVDQIGETQEVRDALISRTGGYGNLLRLVEMNEQAALFDTHQLSQLLDHFSLSNETFFNIQKEAVAWGGNIFEHMGNETVK